MEFNSKVIEIFRREVLAGCLDEPWFLKMMSPEQRVQWVAERRQAACDAFCPEI